MGFKIKKTVNGETVWEPIKAKKYTISKTIEYTGTLPITITADGSALLDYRIYGNTVQDGTPTPEAPVNVVGCGVRTGNLFDKKAKSTANGFMRDTMLRSDGTTLAWAVFSVSEYIPIESGAEYYLSDVMGAAFNAPSMCFYDSSKQFLSSVVYKARNSFGFSAPAGAAYVRISYMNAQADVVMLNTGSTALPYEPYGYKLPILSNSTVTNIYLGEAETTRRIKKLVLTGEEGWTRTSNTRCYYIDLAKGCPDNYLKSNAITIICSHYAGQTNTRSGSNEVNEDCVCFFIGGGYELYIGERTITSATDFKSYLAAQYAAGTPVTIWYVLAEPETGVVNEPLMKIGDYADTVSKEQAGVSIPTIAGTTVIDYDGTPKPSQMYIKYNSWSGWNDIDNYKMVNGNWTQDVT